MGASKQNHTQDRKNKTMKESIEINDRPAPAPESESAFRNELQIIINCHSRENGSDTPDFILAEYLSDCLRAFDNATTKRAYWYGHKKQPVPTEEPTQKENV